MGKKLAVPDSNMGAMPGSLLRAMSPGWIVPPGSLDPHYIELASTAWAGQKDYFPCSFPCGLAFLSSYSWSPGRRVCAARGKTGDAEGKKRHSSTT